MNIIITAFQNKQTILDHNSSITAPDKPAGLRVAFTDRLSLRRVSLHAHSDRHSQTAGTKKQTKRSHRSLCLSRLIYRVNIDAILLFIQITFHLTYHFQFYHFRASCARSPARTQRRVHACDGYEFIHVHM